MVCSEFRRSFGVIDPATGEFLGEVATLTAADSTLAKTTKVKFAISGQDCVAANHNIVERAIYAKFRDKLVSARSLLDSEEGVVAGANDTEYGLVAYLHSANPRGIYRVSRALAFGMVADNRTQITGAPIPFTGTKQSDIGREGARLGMEEFTETIYVCCDWA